MTDQITSAAPAAAPAPAPAPAAAPAPPSAWHAGLDADTQGWLQNRGLHTKDAAAAAIDLVQQNRNLEKLRGVPADRVLTLPSDPGDKASLDAIYNRLGRPAAPADYKLPTFETGEDRAVAEAMAPVFHANGLNPTQATTVYKAFVDYAVKEARDADAAAETAQAAAAAKLKADWGATYDTNVQVAKNVVSKLSVSEEQKAALVKVIGNDADVTRLFADIGQRTKEAGFVGGAAGYTGGASTPEAAKQRISELTRDPAFGRRYYANDAEAVALIRNLTRVAAGMAPA